jgi:DNA-directed RNA polymerase subunit RPC12/RpoP
MRVMRKWLRILLALAILTICFFGCAGTSKETKVRCPQCGAIIIIDESLEGVRRGLPQAPK